MKKVGILPSQHSSGLLRTLDALGEVFCVHFEERIFGDDAGIDAWILQAVDLQTLPTIAHCDRPCFTVIFQGHLLACGESSTIKFSRHGALPRVISGRQIKFEEAVGVNALPKWLQNITPLASKGLSPIWAVQEAEGCDHHFVSLPIPELNDSEPLFQHFCGDQFLFLLPLLIFLRNLCEDPHWEPPPLQSCFMFDDPNLHWPTYGFIDFAEMARHAQLNNYHVSFATIPLDAWFVHLPTAQLFKKHHNHLSLLIHGNDHVVQELARPYSDEERNSVLLQALMRIAKLEMRSGVEVSRVMAPPHGACRENTFREMVRLGFEALCISRGSMGYYNGQARWLFTFGMRPSDMIEGLTVYPRFRMSRTCHNSILVAALLHQPIIPVGHHYDIAEGLKLLGGLSEYINSLGRMHWSDLKKISRSHYSRRFDGTILRIRMFTKRVEINVPEGIRQVFVENMWPEGTENGSLAWRVLDEKIEWNLLRPDESIPALSGKKIEIASFPPTSLSMDTKNLRTIKFWPMARRQLSEARDRMSPFLKRISAF